jgi:hypothetical protein
MGATMTDEDANKKLTARVVALEAKLEIKDGIIAELLKRIYGAKSEKLDTSQLLLDLLGDEPKKPDAAGPEDVPAAEPSPEKKNPKKRRRQKLRDSLKALPTVTTEIIPREVLDAPGDYRRIGQEESERLEVGPATFTRHVTIRPTYVKKGDPEAVPTTAPLPVPLLEGSVLSASLGAHLLTEKWVLPSTQKDYNTGVLDAQTFAEWYGIADGTISADIPAVDPRNWAASHKRQDFKQKWFFIGVDGNGKKWKGEGVVELVTDN